MPSHTGSGIASTKAQIQTSELIYADASGSSGNFVITLSPAITAYTDGMIIAFSANHAPASTATLNVNSVGAKAIKKNNDQDLVSGDIENGQRVVVQYDADADVFEMVSQVGNLPAASTTASGIVELATDAEALSATDATRAVTPGNLGANIKRIYKSADETVNNSNTLQNDDHLLFAVGANEVWAIQMYFIFLSGATPDLKYTFTLPASATISFFSALTFNEETEAAPVVASGVGAGGGTTIIAEVITGTVTTAGAAGNVQFQWAQNTATVADSKVLKGSYIIAHRLA